MKEALKNRSFWTTAYSLCERIFFPLFLLLYPMRHVHLGVEWWDTGYNYGNFVYMDSMDPMWVFSTYLGNALGNLFTKLPFGDRMLGMNVYTGLFVSALALMGYYFFLKKVKLPAWMCFAGEMLAISLCWCPTALLYNYLTYLLMAAAVILLYCGLSEDGTLPAQETAKGAVPGRKARFLVLAGICLGVNVFVRFPNLAEMAFIVAVWAYGMILRRPFVQVLRQTLWCILGYVIGMGACLGYLAVRYGFAEYVDAIVRLLSMPSEASDYTLYSMVLSQLQNYQYNLRWLLALAGFALAGVIVYAVWPKQKLLLKIAQVGYVGCVFAGFYFLMNRNMFNMTYTTKMSVFQWAIFLLVATIIGGCIVILRKNFTPQRKLMAGLAILVVLISPLGSNNHLYTSINNLFLVAPFTVYLLYELLKWLPAKYQLRRITLYNYPVKAMLLAILFMIFFQSLCFGYVYVFIESGGGENLHTKVENNDILKGMYTSPDRAKVLSEVSAYVEAEDLKGKEVLLYGNIPSLSYYLEMPYVLSSWPDLRSYNYQVMEEELEALTARAAAGEQDWPILLLDCTCLDKEPGADAKWELIRGWMQEHQYRQTFVNEKFIIYQKEG